MEALLKLREICESLKPIDFPNSHTLHTCSAFVDEVRSLVERNVEPTDYRSFTEDKPELFMFIDFESDVVSALFNE